MPILYTNTCFKCNKETDKCFYISEHYQCETCFEDLYSKDCFTVKTEKKQKKVIAETVETTKVKVDRASYALVAAQLQIKGYTEIEVFTGRKARKVVEWLHKDKKRLPIFVVIYEGTCREEDRVVGLSVGLNYPERSHVREFMDKI